MPINKNNNHWLLLRVDFEASKIMLWDSLGPDRDNQDYPRHMLQYLYDVHQCLHPDSVQTLESWQDKWTLVDESDDCPRQENLYDCGVFTLVNMALVAQGVSLQRSSYSQCLVYRHRTRHRIADMIKESGDTTHTIATWLHPRSKQTAAPKSPMGASGGPSSP